MREVARGIGSDHQLAVTLEARGIKDKALEQWQKYIEMFPDAEDIEEANERVLALMTVKPAESPAAPESPETEGAPAPEPEEAPTAEEEPATEATEAPAAEEEPAAEATEED